MVDVVRKRLSREHIRLRHNQGSGGDGRSRHCLNRDDDVKFFFGPLYKAAPIFGYEINFRLVEQPSPGAAHPPGYDIIDDRVDIDSGDRSSAEIERFQYLAARTRTENKNLWMDFSDVGNS